MKNSIINKIVFGVVVLLLLLVPDYVVAQRRIKVPNMPKYDESPIHFGFYLGGNLMFAQVRPEAMYPSLPLFMPDVLYAVEALPAGGFSVGLVGNVRLGRYFDFRFCPGLQFAGRVFMYKVPVDGRGSNSEVRTANVNSVAVDIPLHIKFKSQRIQDYRLYMLAGPAIRFDVYQQKIKTQDLEKIYFMPDMKGFDIAGDVGVGVDFYMNWFKMGIELKYSMGVLNKIVKKNEPSYTNGIKTIRDNVLQLILTFE